MVTVDALKEIEKRARLRESVLAKAPKLSIYTTGGGSRFLYDLVSGGPCVNIHKYCGQRQDLEGLSKDVLRQMAIQNAIESRSDTSMGVGICARIPKDEDEQAQACAYIALSQKNKESWLEIPIVIKSKDLKEVYLQQEHIIMMWSYIFLGLNLDSQIPDDFIMFATNTSRLIKSAHVLTRLPRIEGVDMSETRELVVYPVLHRNAFNEEHLGIIQYHLLANVVKEFSTTDLEGHIISIEHVNSLADKEEDAGRPCFASTMDSWPERIDYYLDRYPTCNVTFVVHKLLSEERELLGYLSRMVPIRKDRLGFCGLEEKRTIEDFFTYDLDYKNLELMKAVHAPRNT